MKEKRRRKKRKSLVSKFIKIVVSTVLIFVVVGLGGIFAYSRLVGFDNIEDEVVQGSHMSFLDAVVKKDIILNIVLFGVDGDETRTDVILVGQFNSKTGRISLMSIPRDTRVEISDTMYAYLKSNGKYIPQNGICKINEVHAYAGAEKANEFSIIQIEELLGIEIDHYAKVNFDGFGDVVDLIGGVEFYVPQDMYWDMRDTGDILIDLDEGLQVLDGDKAQQLVRFRRYPLGDEERVKVQQDFMEAVAETVLTSETLVLKLPDLIETAYEYIETDVVLSDALKYVQYVEDIELHKMETTTIPGSGQTINGVSYFIVDEENLDEAVQQAFFNTSEDVASVDGEETNESTTESDEVIIFDSKEKNIEILNGGNISGLAGENKTKLVEAGYNIVNVANYFGDKTEHTRIVVNEKGTGEDLVKDFYSDGEIIVDKSLLSDNVDIMIILGTDERL